MSFEGKNGIELEMDIKRDNRLENSIALEEFRRSISSRFYYDDGKPEYPSRPYNNLGDLEDEILSVIKGIYEITEHHNWKVLMLGTDISSNNRFSSAHVHQSISKIPTERDIKLIRERLASIQHFIALLGQNSNILNGKITYCKDARLGYSIWSEFTPYETNNFSHYLSLATGLSGHSNVATLEVRIPSSSCLLEQLFGNIILIRTFSRLLDVPILPLSDTRKSFYRVVRFGGEAVIPILKPLGVGYLGIKGKKVYVKVSELFKLLLKDDIIKDLMKESLSQLSTSLRKRVIEFYNTITKGHTISDYIESTYKSVDDINSLESILSEALKNSYLNKESFKNVLVEPKENTNNIFVPSLTLEELNEMIKKYDTSFIFEDYFENIEEILETSKYSVKKNKFTRLVFYKLSKTNKLSNVLISQLNNSLQDFLIEKKIITSNYKKGDKFYLIFQLAKDRGLL